MERLTDEDRVDAIASKRNRLCAARERGAVQGSHALVGLDRDHVSEAGCELARQASSTGREVEDPRGCVEPERLLRSVQQ